MRQMFGFGRSAIKPAADSSLARVDVSEIRGRMLLAVADCTDPAATRLRFRIDAALSAPDLWLMRSDLYQLVSGQHSQAEAALRVNQLLSCFEGWVPSSQLSRI